MNATTINQYYTMLEKFEQDEITQQQWFAYCALVLEEIMEENKDVLIRLKNRRPVLH
jgi:hypothetical protein